MRSLFDAINEDTNAVDRVTEAIGPPVPKSPPRKPPSSSWTSSPESFIAFPLADGTKLSFLTLHIQRILIRHTSHSQLP